MSEEKSSGGRRDTEFRSPDRPQAAPSSARRGDESRLPSVDVSVVAITGLVGARFFQLAESGDQGDTLWLAVLTFIGCAVQHWFRWRVGERFRPFDRIDAAVITLVAAHLVSALAVVLDSGQKRAAINLGWEWLSSLLLWFEFRRLFDAGRGATLLRTIVVLGVALAGYGIWQNQVWFRQNAALVNEHEELSHRSATLSTAERQQLQSIGQQLGPDFQSATGGTRKMLIDRFRSSTEPLGCFGLANTFAGVLVVSLWLALAVGLRIRGAPSRAGQLAAVAVVALIGLCLVMTKSRTAFAGMLASAGLYLFVFRTGKWARQGTIAVLTVVASGAALLGLALLTGLIDEQVISESSKSLRYRLEYWTATSKVILDHPWLGVGPGNFRSAYLHHKLKGASEEVLDPHNLLLDVWANGGVIAWAGLVALLIWGLRTGWRAVLFEVRTGPPALPVVRWSEGLWSAAAGPGLVAAQQLLFGGGAETRIWGFLFVCPLIGGWLASLVGGFRIGAIWAAWLGLSVHLCGAGGIAMPVIFQLWCLLLAALVTAPQQVQSEAINVPQTETQRGSILTVALAVAYGVLAVACLRTGLIPTALSRAEISLATETISSTGQRAMAERQLIAAAENDPLSPEPWGLLLSLRGSGEPDELESAIEAGREAIARNPENSLYYEALGDLLVGVRPATPETRTQAIEWYQAAARRYPNSVRIRTSLALVLADAGNSKEAVTQATLAVELDDLNRAALHLDKVLVPERRVRLEQILQAAHP